MMGSWKHMAGASKNLLIAACLEFLVVLALTLEDLISAAPMTSANREHFLFGFLFLGVSMVVLYFACNGIIKENAYELGVANAFLILTVIYCVYNVAYPPSKTPGAVNTRGSVLVARLVVVSVFCVFSLPYSYHVYTQFGWRSYKAVGASPEKQRAFEIYSLFLSLIKFDCLMGFVTLYLAGLTILHESGIIVDSCALLFTFIAAVCGAQSVMREREDLFWIFFVSMFPEPAYIVYKFVDYGLNTHKYHDKVKYMGALIACAAIAFVLRFVVIIVAFMARANFGMNIATSVHEAEEREGQEKTHFAFDVDSKGNVVINPSA